MSRFEYDFERPLSDIYYTRPNTAIKDEPAAQREKIDIGEFLDAIHKFSASLTPEDFTKFQQAQLAAKTTNNNMSSEHIWYIFTRFFLQSLRSTYSDSDLIQIENKIKDIDIKSVSKESIDNTSFRVYLLGMISALI
jgi:hypothetical protein